MKKIISLIVLLVGLGLVTNCSKDDDTKLGVIENAKVESYLKNFYATRDYKLGRSLDVKEKRGSTENSRSIVIDNYTLTEVFVGNDTIARGYIITMVDSNDFKYFIDVDRVDFKLTTVKVENNDVKVYENIDHLTEYLRTNKFDVYQMASTDQDADIVLGKRKFWGTGYSWGACGPNTDGSAGCFQGEYSQHYILWCEDGPSHATGVTQSCSCP